MPEPNALTLFAPPRNPPAQTAVVLLVPLGHSGNDKVTIIRCLHCVLKSFTVPILMNPKLLHKRLEISQNNASSQSNSNVFPK